MRGHRFFVWAMVLVCVSSLSCVSLTAHQRAFAVGALTRVSVEQAHDVWNLYVEDQLAKCDPATNAEIATKSDYSACLGPAFQNPKIVVAIEAVDLALEALGIALKGTNPTSIASARDRVLRAAQDAIALMGPDVARFGVDLKRLIDAQR